MVMRINTPKLLLPEARAASSRAASIAMNAGVSSRNLTEVLKAIWHQTIPPVRIDVKRRLPLERRSSLEAC